MKRTVWSILTAAAAAVLPGFTGPTVDLAPVAAESLKPTPEAVCTRKAEVRELEKRLDEHDDDPTFASAQPIAIDARATLPAAPAVERAPSASPDVAPLARRALGRPRVRAPDRTV